MYISGALKVNEFTAARLTNTPNIPTVVKRPRYSDTRHKY